MSAQTAKIVDLDAYRQARNAPRQAPMATNAVAPMAWVPVMFVPVYWFSYPSIAV